MSRPIQNNGQKSTRNIAKSTHPVELTRSVSIGSSFEPQYGHSKRKRRRLRDLRGRSEGCPPARNSRSQNGQVTKVSSSSGVMVSALPHVGHADTRSFS